MSDLDKLEVFQKKRAQIWNAIEEYESRASNFRYDHNNFLTTLANKTQEFFDLGVAVVNEYDNQEYRNKLGDTLVKYLREVNKSFDRPFILLQASSEYLPNKGWGKLWTLIVPKTPKLKNVVAGLLILADDNASPEKMFLTHVYHERKWEFKFFTKQGIEFKDHWLEQCKTDPVFRICMMLPPKVT